MRKCRIGIFFLIVVMLTACASNANVPEDIVPVQPEVYVVETGSEIGMDESGIGETSEATEQKVESEEANETSENSAETAETDESGEIDIVYLKPCKTYQDILDNAYEVIVADYTTNVIESDDAFTYVGVAETRIGQNVDETLSSVGYTLYDVDGNGVEELIIVDTGEDGSPWNNRILIMASLLNDKPVEVAEGWARNRFYLLNDNTIYYEGSGGAAYTTFATYRMAEDGVSLEVIDYYFSDYRDDSSEEYWLVEGNWGWFHNTTGGYKDESEWIEFENEDIPWEMMENYLAQVRQLDLTFFETLGP